MSSGVQDQPRKQIKTLSQKQKTRKGKLLECMRGKTGPRSRTSGNWWDRVTRELADGIGVKMYFRRAAVLG